MLTNIKQNNYLYQNRPWKTKNFTFSLGLKPTNQNLYPLLCQDAFHSQYLENKISLAKNNSQKHIPKFVKIKKREIIACYETINTFSPIPLNHYNVFQSNQPESDFHNICLNFQEDFAVWKSEPQKSKEWISGLHLFAPNHWKPDHVIGKSFQEIHTSIPNMEKISNMGSKIFDLLYSAPIPQERYAWGIVQDLKLNKYPESKSSEIHLNNSSGHYIRLERQVFIPVKPFDIILFTIRTYFIDPRTLETSDKQLLIKNINSMNSDILKYKNLSQKKDRIHSYIMEPMN